MSLSHTACKRFALATLVASALACAQADDSDMPFTSHMPAAAAASDGGSERTDAADAAMPQLAGSYLAVADIMQHSCAYERCHDGRYFGGALLLPRNSNFAGPLVNVTACQYERMKRVEPYHPERSWLMIKLTARVHEPGDPYENFIYFEPDADWDPNQRACPSETDDGTPLFGTRMPLTAPNMLPESDIETIRQWIAEGAPYER